MELSPEDIRKDKDSIIPKDFKITIFFEDFCDKCDSETTAIEDLCEKCSKQLGTEEIEDWKETRTIL